MALVIGDIHFKVSNVIETDQLLKSIKKIIKNRGDEFEFVVLLGDILDTFNRTEISVLHRASNFILSISEKKKVYVIIGNHDRENNDVFLNDKHFFTGLKGKENIVIVDEVVVEDEYVFVPYVYPGRFQEALDTYFKSNDEKLEDKKVIFCHQEFYGCKMGFVTSEKGDKWSEDNIPVISGHIHEFHIPQSNIIYVPTPYQMSYTDESEKFIGLFSFNKKEKKENKYTKGITYDKVESGIRKKVQITLSLEDFKEWEWNGKDNTRVIIEGDGKVIKSFVRDYQLKLIKEYGRMPEDLMIIIRNTVQKEVNKMKLSKLNEKGMSFSERLMKVVKNIEPALQEKLEEIIHEEER